MLWGYHRSYLMNITQEQFNKIYRDNIIKVYNIPRAIVGFFDKKPTMIDR